MRFLCGNGNLRHLHFGKKRYSHILRRGTTGGYFFIENTREFHGKYHVLNGVISPLEGIGPRDLRIKELLERIEPEQVKEVLVATNPTLEGDATADYLANQLKPLSVSVTRIAYGITVGGSIELADQYTLGRAIRSRLQL